MLERGDMNIFFTGLYRIGIMSVSYPLEVSLISQKLLHTVSDKKSGSIRGRRASDRAGGA